MAVGAHRVREARKLLADRDRLAEPALVEHDFALRVALRIAVVDFRIDALIVARPE